MLRRPWTSVGPEGMDAARRGAHGLFHPSGRAKCSRQQKQASNSGDLSTRPLCLRRGSRWKRRGFASGPRSSPRASAPRGGAPPLLQALIPIPGPGRRPHLGIRAPPRGAPGPEAGGLRGRPSVPRRYERLGGFLLGPSAKSLRTSNGETAQGGAVAARGPQKTLWPRRGSPGHGPAVYGRGQFRERPRGGSTGPPERPVPACPAPLPGPRRRDFRSPSRSRAAAAGSERRRRPAPALPAGEGRRG